jgi:hypothetical protein
MKLIHTMVPHWPALAWLAECTTGDTSIRVYCGESVETNEEWFCEAVWAGDFLDGALDATDIVAGSGARIRQRSLVFVSAGTNIDRLHSFRRGNTTLVANSLCCLLAWVGGKADLAFRQYEEHFSEYGHSIFGEHRRVFPSSVGPIDITYFANLVWDGERLSEIDKPNETRRFATFLEYRDFLRHSMELFTRNATSATRTRPLKVLCAISRGYDSPAVAVLVREATERVEAFTFVTDRDGWDDSGESLARTLDIPCHVLDRDAWRNTTLPEVPFLAGSASVGDMPVKSAEPLLGGTVLFTGVNSDATWRRKKASPEIEFDGTFLGVTEYRLGVGFISCSVPTWGIRQRDDLVRISNSAEMARWDVGGSYNKPIPRRIVETAGIARGQFATRKSGISMARSARKEYLVPSSRRDFFTWLAQHRKQPPGGGSVPSPRFARLLDAMVTPPSRLVGALIRLRNDSPLRRVPKLGAVLHRLRRDLRQPYYHYKYLVHWAVDRQKERYVGRQGND